MTNVRMRPRLALAAKAGSLVAKRSRASGVRLALGMQVVSHPAWAELLSPARIEAALDGLRSQRTEITCLVAFVFATHSTASWYLAVPASALVATRTRRSVPQYEGGMARR